MMLTPPSGHKEETEHISRLLPMLGHSNEVVGYQCLFRRDNYEYVKRKSLDSAEGGEPRDVQLESCRQCVFKTRSVLANPTNIEDRVSRHFSLKKTTADIIEEEDLKGITTNIAETYVCQIVEMLRARSPNSVSSAIASFSLCTGLFEVDATSHRFRFASAEQIHSLLEGNPLLKFAQSIGNDAGIGFGTVELFSGTRIPRRDAVLASLNILRPIIPSCNGIMEKIIARKQALEHLVLQRKARSPHRKLIGMLFEVAQLLVMFPILVVLFVERDLSTLSLPAGDPLAQERRLLKLRLKFGSLLQNCEAAASDGRFGALVAYILGFCNEVSRNIHKGVL